ADEHRIGSRGGIGLDVRGGDHGGFADREGAGGDPGQQIGGAAEVDGEVLEVAGVDADDVRLEGEGALELAVRVGLDEGLHAELGREVVQLAQLDVVEGGDDEQHEIGAVGAGL